MNVVLRYISVAVFAVYEVNRKVRHLRTYYAKLLRERSKKKIRRGKPWQFFDQMEFLHDHIVSRMTKPVTNVRIIYIYFCYCVLFSGLFSRTMPFPFSKGQCLESPVG